MLEVSLPMKEWIRGSGKAREAQDCRVRGAGFEQLCMGVGHDGGCGAAGGEQADQGMDRGSGKAREAQDCRVRGAGIEQLYMGVGQDGGCGAAGGEQADQDQYQPMR